MNRERRVEGEKEIRIAGFCACLGAAALAWFIGKALNVPEWRSGWDMGDRTDMAVFAFFTLRWTIRALRPPAQNEGVGS
jgi:hypothetical protein